MTSVVFFSLHPMSIEFVPFFVVNIDWNFTKNLRIANRIGSHVEFAKENDTHPFIHSSHKIHLKALLYIYPQLQMLLGTFTKDDYPNFKCAMMSSYSSIFYVLPLTFWHLLKPTKQKALLSKMNFFLFDAFFHFLALTPSTTTYYLFGTVIFYSISNSGMLTDISFWSIVHWYGACGAYLNCFSTSKFHSEKEWEIIESIE